MKIAYIYGKENKDYCGDGAYELVFNNEVIGNHYCSNRSFANHDLTVWRLEELNKHEIDKVISNEEVVWERDNEEIKMIYKEVDLIVLEADGWQDLVVFERKYKFDDIVAIVDRIKKKEHYDNEMIYKSLELMFEVKEIICINNVEKVEY